MGESATSRQDVLKQLWDSSGPSTLWQILEREPAARASGISEELRREAEDVSRFNSSMAERLVLIAEEIERIRGSIDRFAAIESIGDLLDLYRSHPICHSNNFNRLLGVFWLDALQCGDTATAANLRRGMKLLSTIYVAVNLIKHSKEMDPKEWARTIQADVILVDPSFHQFLDERAHFLAKQVNPHAEGFAQMATYIRTCSRLAPAIVQIEDRDRGSKVDGPIKVHIPVSPDQAELWFLVSKDFTKLATDLAEEVASGTRMIESGMEEASQYAARNLSPDRLEDPGEDEKTIEVFLASAFLEHLLRLSKPPVVAEAIASYARLSENGRWNTAEKRAIFVLHYTKAALNYWRYLEMPLARLTECADLIEQTLSSVDDRTPRLLRDLWFTRARLLENVGFWRPEAFPESIAAYERGLSVAKVKHEAEARGRALTDYANTMSRLRTANDEDHDRKIMDTYEEALTTFGMETSVIGRTLALNSFAIYLNDRLHGDRSANQERALKLIQEAIDLLETDERADRQNDLVGRTLASAHLAKSNILHRREVGDELESVQAAIDSLHTALDRLGKSTVDNQLRGIINLNLGHFNLEVYAMTGETAKVRDAMYAYQEAEALLQSFPQEYSQALLGTAMLVSEIDEYRTPEGVNESIAMAEKATQLLQATEDLQARARARVCLGELHSLRASAGDFEIAVDSFQSAMSDFLEAGHYQNAITAARRLAALWIERFLPDGGLSDVREAEQVLQQATEWVERIWSQVDSVQWRFTVSDRFSSVYAEIAWCRATLGDPPDAIAFALARAKGREFLTHSAELGRSMRTEGGLGVFLDELRVESRRAEHTRWQAARTARLDVDVSEATQRSRQQLRDIELRRRLSFPPPAPEGDQPPLRNVEAFLDLHPKAVILDLTICRWGTVVLLAGGRETGVFAGSVVRVLPLPESAAGLWVEDWSSAYGEYLLARGVERESARVRWAEQTDAILAKLSKNIMQPCLSAPTDPSIELIIVAGRLAGLPLHAATLSDGRFVTDGFASVTYCPNIAVLSSEPPVRQKPSTALFVVSDRDGDLVTAAKECQVAIDQISGGETAITVLAQIGDESGRAALLQRGVELPADVKVVEAAPTPERVAELLPHADHFFYSGHGVQRGTQSGLILMNDNGEPKLLSEDDILSMRALRGRPLVVLSACETAMGGQGSAELFDTASSFLRIGARFVVGSLWVVVEDCATQFTAEFYKALASNKTPGEAFGTAARATRQHRAAILRDRSVPADHPIYWAPFMAIQGG